MSILAFTFFLNVIFLPTLNFAQNPDTIDINSNYMEMIDAKKMIIFTGDVVAKRGDVTLYTEKLDVYYQENPDTRKKEMDYMIATGNVKVIQNEKTAIGEMARYSKKEDMIVLEGKPAIIIEKGENQVTGSKITFYLKENKSFIEGNRPRIIFKTGE
jgi:lipopolysaccharide export system protein LptA